MLMTKDAFLNPVKGKEQDLIELFVDFFGEKYRDKITHQVNTTQFFFVDRDPVESLENMYSDKKQTILQKYYTALGFKPGAVPAPEDLETMKEYIHKKSYKYDFMSAMRLTSLILSLGIGRFDGDIAKYFRNPVNYIKLNSALNKAIKLWHTEYKEECDELDLECQALGEPFREFNKTSQNVASQYDEKITNLFRKKIKSLLGDNYSGNFFEYMAIRSNLQSLYALGKDRLDDEFLLNEEGRQGLMGMFQAFGFDHGDDYEKYIKDPKLINAIFDEDFLFKINELEKAKILKTFEINPQFLDAKTRVDDLDLATGNLELSVSLLTYLTTPQMGGFIQNHFTKDGKLQVLCVCPMASSLDDEVFIHEAGHAIHSSIISRDGNHYKVKNGIETLDYYAEEEFYDTELLMKNGSVERKAVDYMPGLLESNRKYKILNEVLHDVLTKMLLQMAKERGLTFGHKTDNPTTLYSNASSLVEDFVKNNLPLLKDSYMGDDPELFVRSFGTENLDKLASAVENVVTISMSDRDAIMEELNVDNIFSKDMLAFAKQSKKYSSIVRAYLDNYLTADSAIKDYEHSKQM